MNNENAHICERCGKEFFGDWRKDRKSRKQPIRFCSISCSKAHTPSQEHREKTRESVKKFCENAIHHCKYCGRACKDDASLDKHVAHCKLNPDRPGGKMPMHTRHYYNRPMSMGKGVVLNVTRAFVDQYRQEHPVCEICGKSVDEVVKTKSKFGPHSLCVDHDHATMEFRGLLCAVCNRQLGWYEKHKEAINKYLNKGPVV